MEIGIIAGNRNLPILLAKRISESKNFKKITAICFKGETSPSFCRYVDNFSWVNVGSLGDLKRKIQASGVRDWIMAGQINPLNIFKVKKWDSELKGLFQKNINFCPHVFFKAIISYLEKEGVIFQSCVGYLSGDLASQGPINGIGVTPSIASNFNFGLEKIKQYVEMDIGQVLVVKNNTVVAAEAIEGTDNAIKRGCRLAGKKAIVFKFARQNQDLRFDVPVVGISTLKLLIKINAGALVLEKGKTIILEKEKFIGLSKKNKIPLIGA